MISTPGVPDQGSGENTAEYLHRLTLEELRLLRRAVAAERTSISDEGAPSSPYRSAAYRGLRYAQWQQWIEEEIDLRKRCEES